MNDKTNVKGFFAEMLTLVPEENKRAYWEYTIESNLSRSCAIHMCMLLMNLTIIALLGLISSGEDKVFYVLDWVYSYAIVACAAISLLTVILILKLRYNTTHIKMLDHIVFISTIVLAILSGLVTCYEFFFSSQFLRHALMSIAVSSLVCYSLYKDLLIVASGFISFFIGYTLMSIYNPQGTSQLNMDSLVALTKFPIIISMAAYMILCIAITVANNRRNYRDFVRMQSAMSHQEELEELTMKLNIANKQLLEMSAKDSLTGLNNRRSIDEYLDSIWPKCCADGTDISILMVDVDHFKSYNDKYGHQAGDEGLRMIAKVLNRSFVPEEGMLARYGGEEFIAVIPSTQTDAVISLAEKIRVEVEDMGIANPLASNLDNVLTVSVGVLLAKAKDAMSIDACIKLADDALYSAKSRGRNTIEVVSIA